MARLARLVIPGLPCHTQRGNRRGTTSKTRAEGARKSVTVTVIPARHDLNNGGGRGEKIGYCHRNSQPRDAQGKEIKERAQAGGRIGTAVTPYMNLFPRFFLNDPKDRMSESERFGRTFIHDSGHMTLGGQLLAIEYREKYGAKAFRDDHQAPWSAMAGEIWNAE